MGALHFTMCKALPSPSHTETLEGSQAGIMLSLCAGEETRCQGEMTGPWQSRDPAHTSLLPVGAVLPAHYLLLFPSRGSRQES